MSAETEATLHAIAAKLLVIETKLDAVETKRRLERVYYVLPELKDIHVVSKAIAFAVGKMAQQQGVAVKTSADALQQAIDENFWKPEYRSYRRTSI